MGASQTTGTYLIPRLVGSFQQKYPGVTVKLTVGSTRSICQEVAQGEIDVAIVGGEVPEELMDNSSIQCPKLGTQGCSRNTRLRPAPVAAVPPPPDQAAGRECVQCQPHASSKNVLRTV